VRMFVTDALRFDYILAAPWVLNFAIRKVGFLILPQD
jgi:hypothetical protein